MNQQRGGTILGFIIGVVFGLAAALAVAVYVTKVPVPFMNKGGQSRSAEQDVAEARKNKDWDPNAALYGKNPAKPAAVVASAPAVSEAVSAPARPDAKAETKSKAEATAKADAKGKDGKPVVADPLGELALAKAAASASESYSYFVQVGAFHTMEDAEAHRAKLSLSGIETKISEREQKGQTVFRVRVGPFDKKEDGEAAKERLTKVGLETALVRVVH